VFRDVKWRDILLMGVGSVDERRQHQEDKVMREG
jgi:hypothetical protein